MFTTLQKAAIVLSITSIALILSGCKPDLKVTEFDVGTLTTDTAEGYYVAPATITVENVGADPCESGFTVGVYTVSDPDYHPLTYYTVPGEFEMVPKWPTDALDEGESVTWTGTIYIRGIKKSGPANVAVWADVYDEIDESIETNNEYMVPKDVPPWP